MYTNHNKVCFAEVQLAAFKVVIVFFRHLKRKIHLYCVCVRVCVLPNIYEMTLLKAPVGSVTNVTRKHLYAAKILHSFILFFKVIFTHVSMSSSTCLMLLMMKIIYIQLDCLQFGWQLKQKKIDRNSNIVKNKECAVWPVSV